MRRIVYRIRLINTETKATLLAWTFTSRKKAEEFVRNWKAQGNPFDAEIVAKERR